MVFFIKKNSLCIQSLCYDRSIRPYICELTSYCNSNVASLRWPLTENFVWFVCLAKYFDSDIRGFLDIT